MPLNYMAEKIPCGLNKYRKRKTDYQKILMNKQKLYNTNQLHHNSKILKITDSAELRILLFAFDNKSFINRKQRNKTLRNFYNLPITTETFHYINITSDEAIIRWNSLPNNIKSITNKNKFKEKLVETYEYLDNYK